MAPGRHSSASFAAGRCKEGLEEPAMAMMTIEEKLRVPLDAEEESLGRRFNGFNDAVRSPRAGMQRRRDYFDRLVMRAVDAHRCGLDDPMEQALGSDADGMTEPSCRC